MIASTNVNESDIIPFHSSPPPGARVFLINFKNKQYSKKNTAWRIKYTGQQKRMA